MRLWWWAPSFLLLLSACDVDGELRPVDAGLGDGSRLDGGDGEGGGGGDAAARDAGADDRRDAASIDAGGSDAGVDPPGWGLLSLNLHCLDTEGTAYATNADRLAAVAARVITEDVSVLLLQEVCDDGETDALEVLESELEARTAAAWDSAFGFAHLAWEGTADEAEEGVAILAKAPLRDVEVTEHLAQGALRRVTVEATLHDSLGAVRVASFHLDHLAPAVRTEQARELAVATLVGGDSGANAIAAGDLNDREGTAAHDALLAAGFVDASAPLRATRIDHLFVHRGASVAATDARLLFDAAPTRVSDHPGVLARLIAAEPPEVPITVVVAHVDVGLGHTVTIRGDASPLSWERGWPLLNLAADEWRFATTEISAPFAFKLLRDDATWQAGDDVAGTAGTRNDVSPTF